MCSKLSYLKSFLDESSYTVALCGSGMMEEGGFIGVKKQERDYEIETTYGYSADEIFSSAFYNTRPELFFEFYKKEMLEHAPRATQSSPAMASLEHLGKLNCVVCSNIYDQARLAGCKNVINLHGSIYENQCPRCKRNYPLEYIKSAKRVPLCETCGIPVRPLVNLFGEQVDSQLMTRTTEEVSKADLLLLLGTTLESEVYRHYINYFEGRRLAIIHQSEHYKDHLADLVIVDQPQNVLPELVKLYNAER
ncbi:SIR2 family NAD-dependent protein deacylase [Enterocloster lavalensis]|uniref:SIR2 family NAD-dependent protein deacylase n=1 Tax=Enterocloster lavalensis TaxID=460384 RepID=UPI002666DFA2|nr:Sir2 family NAD-dependent protein deacetylase [Enterocloster lavalensis]